AALVVPSLRKPPAPPEPIVFFEPEGIRQGSTWVVGTGEVRPLGDGVICLETKPKAPALLLLETPGWERYRFRVRVQDHGVTDGAGLFFASRRIPTDRETAHWFCEFSFLERNEHRPPGVGPNQRKLARQALPAVLVRRYAERPPATPLNTLEN